MVCTLSCFQGIDKSLMSYLFSTRDSMWYGLCTLSSVSLSSLPLLDPTSLTSLPNSAGIVAPLITGALLQISSTLPLYLSAITLLGGATCMLLLPYETLSDVLKNG